MRSNKKNQKQKHRSNNKNITTNAQQATHTRAHVRQSICQQRARQPRSQTKKRTHNRRQNKTVASVARRTHNPFPAAPRDNNTCARDVTRRTTSTPLLRRQPTRARIDLSGATNATKSSRPSVCRVVLQATLDYFATNKTTYTTTRQQHTSAPTTRSRATRSTTKK